MDNSFEKNIFLTGKLYWVKVGRSAMNRVTMLLDNITNTRKYRKSHGLSIFIEFNEVKILFDTGPNKNFIKNAETMNIELSDTDLIVISHGHSDHTGGLKYLNLPKTTVYCCSNAMIPKFLKIGKIYKYVGIPKKFDSTKLTYIEEKTEILDNIFLLPLNESKEKTKNLYKLKHNKKALDDFSDELILILLKEKNLTIFTGCSHHGIREIIEKVKVTFPDTKIKNVIGGFHMIGIPYLNNLGMSKEKIKDIGVALNNLEVENFYTCHCTGEKAFKILKPILKDKLNYLSTGNSIVF